MSPSLNQIQPERQIAEFGTAHNPHLFLVEEGRIPGQEEIEGREPFVVRDSDQWLPSRRIGAGILEDIDTDKGIASLDFEIDNDSGEPTYTLLPGDVVSAIGAVARDREAKEIRLAHTNLPAAVVERIVGPAELVSSGPDSEPFRFKIAA